MKRIIIFFLVIISLTTLSGCYLVETSSENENFENEKSKITKDMNLIEELRLSTEILNYEILTNQTLPDKIYVSAKTGEPNSYGIRNNYCGESNIAQLIHWVSTNEEVAIVSNGSDTSFFVYLNFETTGEGETEIYAETIDGRIKSEVIKIRYGNQYNKNATAIYDTGKHIISRLKYPTKTTTRIVQDRDPFFFNYKNRRVYTYENDTESSYVNVNTVDILESKAIVKGEVNTFSAGGGNAVCGYIIELQYNDDFTSYTILSEKYDVPELLREKLE